MTPTRSTVAQLLIVALAVAAVGGAAGAGAMYLYLRTSEPAPVVTSGPSAPAAAGGSDGIAITLTPEAASRAGIETVRPSLGPIEAAISVPGIVEPNAYNQVVVRSVAAGQVRTVAVDLGAQVKRGELLATIHTPDLADTVRMYLSMRSEYEAAHQRLTRLEGLVKIGAASQQESEAARAEHTRHATDVESARAKLTLLGVTEDQLASLAEGDPIASTVSITAPRDGTITVRAVNPGANIDASTDMFTVVDLASVWIVANVYERDLERVRIGASATIASPASSERRWTGRISYIDPQLAPETRTAKVRVAVDNARQVLRLGMYMDVTIAAAGSRTTLLAPATAIQTIGSQTVIYVADARHKGRYLERSVVLGAKSGLQIEVLSGVSQADAIVARGSFALRAERDRLGLAPPAGASAAVESPVGAGAPHRVPIDITRDGFVPPSVEVEGGGSIELVFTRRTEDTCAKEIVVPAVSTRKALPLDQPVSVVVRGLKGQTLSFTCGMNMLKGTVVVR